MLVYACNYGNCSLYLVFWRFSSDHSGVVRWEGILIVLGEVGGGVGHTTRVDDRGQGHVQMILSGETAISWNSL